MIKRFLTLALISAVAVSCNKTDESKGGQDTLRSGNWRQSSGVLHFKGNGVDTTFNYFNDAPDCVKDDFLQFKSNFEGVVNNAGNKCNVTDPNERSFTWELLSDDKKLNIYSAEDFFGTANMKGDVISLSDNVLAIRYTIVELHTPNDGKYDTLTFSNVYNKF